MNQCLLLFLNQYKMLRNSFSLKTLFSGRSLLIFVFLAGYFAGAFEAFLWGLNFLKSFPVIGLPIITNLWFFFYFILFIMLVFSNTAIFYSFLYHKKEKSFLFSLPIPDTYIFIKWFSECMVLSSWGFLFLSCPLIISIGIIMKGGVIFYTVAVVFLVVFLMLATSIGLFVAIFLVSIKGRKRSFLFFLLFLAFFAYLLFFILRMPGFLGGGEWPFIVFMTNFFKQINISHKLYLPGTWVARGLWATLSGDLKSMLIFGQLLISTTVLFFYLSIFYAKKRLLKACNQVSYGSTKKAGLMFMQKHFLKGSILQFAIKDLKSFFRDPGQYIQFIIIFSLVILYATNLRGLSEFIDRRFWKMTVYFMNIGALSLTSAAMSIRLLFPQLSMEGKRFWLIGLAPVKKYQFVLGKALPGLLLILISTGTILIYSNIMMNTSRILTLFSMGILFIMIISLGSLAYGMGMVYPNFKEDDSSRIISGFGGILTLLLSMLYISLVLSAVAFPVYGYLFKRYASFGRFLSVEIISLVFVIILSACFSIIPIFYGVKNLFKERI